ncbi:MAG: hypothetical protein NC394_02405 [Bacteroides sp.]|nr:hypothetical protein [Bacteroides sp.]
MKKELTAYIKQTEALLEKNGGLNEKKLEGIRINIGFFQHERLVHLIVTMTFALLTVISLGLTVSEIYFLPLFVLFLALEVPYVFHYYRLENGVQKLQRLYRAAEERVTGD